MRKVLIALALLLLGIAPAAAQNYNATAGSGLVFGSKFVGSVNYPQIVFCDPATPAQCVGVNASGQMAIQAPPTLPLPTGAATSANQSSQLTQETATAGALGTTTDAVATVPASGSAASSISLFKAIVNTLNSILTAVQGAIAAGTNYIGQFGIDPSQGGATPAETFLALPATATTQIVALSGSLKTYVTSRVVLAGGTVNVTFKYGTGTNCGTGTTTLDGPWPLSAQAGFSEGNGGNAVMIVPSGQALCVTTDASVSGGVKLTYQQK